MRDGAGNVGDTNRCRRTEAFPAFGVAREDWMDELERDAADADPVQADGDADAATGHARRVHEPDADALGALLRRICGADEAAFATFYDATVGRVYGLALRILREPRAAEDVAEEVFFQVWRQAPRYDPGRGRPLAWVLTMARSRALDHLRRRDPAQSHPEPDTLLDAEPAAEDGPQDLLAASRDCGALHRALASLDPLPRQLIALAFFRGYTHEEIALHADLPVGTVKSHIRRGLAVLRGILDAGNERRPLDHEAPSSP